MSTANEGNLSSHKISKVALKCLRLEKNWRMKKKNTKNKEVLGSRTGCLLPPSERYTDTKEMWQTSFVNSVETEKKKKIPLCVFSKDLIDYICPNFAFFKYFPKCF